LRVRTRRHPWRRRTDARRYDHGPRHLHGGVHARTSAARGGGENRDDDAPLHLPANLFLVAAGLVPDVRLAVAFLLARAALSQMDVPARQAYVMAVVQPEERAAAASVTNVPRSLASALPPLFAGAMLTPSAVGWPLVCGGLLKALYDVLLLARFRGVPGLDEA